MNLSYGLGYFSPLWLYLAVLEVLSHYSFLLFSPISMFCRLKYQIWMYDDVLNLTLNGLVTVCPSSSVFEWSMTMMTTIWSTSILIRNFYRTSTSNSMFYLDCIDSMMMMSWRMFLIQSSPALHQYSLISFQTGAGEYILISKKIKWIVTSVHWIIVENSKRKNDSVKTKNTFSALKNVIQSLMN